MKAPRVMLAAPKSGSGKTLLTIALLSALKDRGKDVGAFKCGPDYIDPMFHRKVIGVPSRNLDTFFAEKPLVRRLFGEGAAGKDLSVLEGVMGLYDGLGGIREEASSYDVAQTLKTPVILVLDAHGMGRSLLAETAGFLHYDRNHLIKGVILNKTTGMFYEAVKPELEQELGIRVFGYFPKQQEICLESRHLGLWTPEEIPGLAEQVRKAGQVLETCVDVEGILEAADQAEELVIPASAAAGSKEKVRIGVAMDEAFCFYYEDNLRLLKQTGARLIPFSPLRDPALPEGLQGILLGGGYPELYAQKLGDNTSMRESVQKALKGNMPSLAECGGFLYLHEELEDMKGRSFPMAGVIPGKAYNTGKLVRFGYVELQEKRPAFLQEGKRIRGHEFHYYGSTANGTDCRAEKPVSGRSWDCIHRGAEYWWGFPHLYYPSCPEFVHNFIERAAEYGKNTSYGIR